MIRRDQNDCTKALIKNCKNSPKRFYGYIRKMQTIKVAVSQLTVKDGSWETSTDEDRYYVTIFNRSSPGRRMCKNSTQPPLPAMVSRSLFSLKWRKYRKNSDS